MNLLHSYVTRQADARPDATAVVFDDLRMTYAELEAQSNQLARLLRDEGCRRGDRVCWLGPKSPAALVAILGIYKAGGVYVPLDNASPAARLKKILDACEPRCVLAGGAAGERLDELTRLGALTPKVRIGWMTERSTVDRAWPANFAAEDLPRYESAAIDSETGPDDPAHIFFTSGSTGTPKGVVITHANVASFIDWAIPHFGIGAGDRHSGHSPLHFDLSMFDIFGTLAAGAELHLLPPGFGILPKQLTTFIESRGLTQWFSVPSVLAYVAKFDAVPHGAFPEMRRLLWCGEVLPTPALIYWMERLPHVTFTNLYGPTETTIASSFYTVPACPADAMSTIPIGAPCGGEELLVLRDDRTCAEPGEVGDLWIGGAGLSPGYWRDADQTRAAFVPDPRPGKRGRLYRTGDLARSGLDGLVDFVGRTDSQIKSRGYRIELGEIETALNAMDGIQECAVVGVPSGGFEGTAIGCAYVLMRDHHVSPAALRAALSTVLQPYMLPSLWLAFEVLPKNANDKIDRPRLREEFVRRAAQAS